MMTATIPTQDEITEFARAWYRKLDVHAPLDDFKPMLAEDVVLVFPEATANGFAGYRDWYERVIRIFFDEAHTVKSVVAAPPKGQDVEVKVVVHWEASVWKAPAPKSERIMLDAYQTWVVRRSSSGAVVIARYVVDSFDYAPNSARL